MEKLFLEIPTLSRKKEALDYLEEHIKYNSELNGTGSMDMCLGDASYEDWLLEIERRKNIEYVSKINRCPSKTFFVVRENDDRIVGMINVRYNISSELINRGASHIGYGIRPTERKKGYAKTALYLGLLEEQKLGETNILLDCTVDNIASNKVIQSLGGKIEKTEIDLNDNALTNYYWINVNDTLRKYFKEYKSKICSKKKKKNIKKRKKV